MIATAPYAEAIRWVALGNAVNLFDRQAIMRQWGELGTFDLLAATKSLDTAAKVHDCIGRLLADLIFEAVAANRGRSQKERQQAMRSGAGLMTAASAARVRRWRYRVVASPLRRGHGAGFAAPHARAPPEARSA